jgi:hypothetical protein
VQCRDCKWFMWEFPEVEQYGNLDNKAESGRTGPRELGICLQDRPELRLMGETRERKLRLYAFRPVVAATETCKRWKEKESP